MTPETQPERTLKDLKEGDRAVIVSIAGHGAFKRRLLEMGFVPGTEIFVKKYAPLRDPIEFVVKGYHVSLRCEEAQLVFIRPEEPFIHDAHEEEKINHRADG